MQIKKSIPGILLTVIFLLQFHYTSAQKDTAVVAVLTADSLASGNYKDVLTSFFKLSFQDITGPQKEVKFTANLFALMLKSNPDLVVDTNYKRYTAARNFNIDLDAKLDSSSKYNGFSLGLKYAIYNSDKEGISLIDNRVIIL